MLKRRRGRRRPPRARDHGLGPGDLPRTVKEKVARFLDLTRADELIISMPVFGMDVRLSSVRLFAEARAALSA